MAKRERLAEPRPNSSARTVDEDGSPEITAADDARFIRELSSLVAIDKLDLDTALMQHADLLYRISERLVDVTALRDRQKAALSEMEALVDQEIRRNAELSETKVTDKAVEMQRKTDKRVVRNTELLADLTIRVGKLSALKEAWLQRKTNMSDLVSLYVGNYWADAESGSASKRYRDAEADRLRDGLAKGRRSQRDKD